MSLWDNQSNTTLCKLDKQQCVSSILAQHRLLLLGHLVRMNDGCLPKKLLVGSPAGGSRAAGGHKCRWNDLVVKDLGRCGVKENWRIVAQDRKAWCSYIRECVEEANEHTDMKEVNRKDKRRRRCKNQAEVHVVNLLAQTEADLINPHWQKLQQP